MKTITILSILLLGCAPRPYYMPNCAPGSRQEPVKTERVRDTTALREVFTNGGYYVPMTTCVSKSKKKFRR